MSLADDGWFWAIAKHDQNYSLLLVYSQIYGEKISLVTAYRS